MHKRQLPHRPHQVVFIEKRCLPDYMQIVTNTTSITYKNCSQHYIGSTTRFIHDRVKEHLANGNSSINKHITICQNNDYKGIEVKIIVMENDPVNLRLFEAFYIRKNKPTLNSREECIEFADLLSSALAEYFISAYPSLTMPP